MDVACNWEATAEGLSFFVIDVGPGERYMVEPLLTLMS
jgi:hypothetical protein